MLKKLTDYLSIFLDLLFDQTDKKIKCLKWHAIILFLQSVGFLKMNCVVLRIKATIKKQKKVH